MDEIIINGTVYAAKKSAPSEHDNRVIVRCRNAGVHVGTLLSRDSVDTVLERANRIWRYRTNGKNGDLSDLAVYGVVRNSYTRISPEVAIVTLTTSDTCEIIPVPNSVDLSEVWNG